MKKNNVKSKENQVVDSPSSSQNGVDETASDVLGAEPVLPSAGENRRRLTSEDLKQGQEAQRSFFEEYDADGTDEIRIASPPKDTPCILCPDSAYSLDGRIIYPKDADPILAWGKAAEAVKPEYGRASRIELYALRDGTICMWLIKRPPEYDREASRYAPLRDLYRRNRDCWFMFWWDNFTPRVEYISAKAIQAAGLPSAQDITFPTCPMVDVLNQDRG